ncbi:uncharacterized protein LOC128718161, partial [Anopheles marshallii]|uniref:uncharacterized protein LOC128718161 n=1 Tax=Anopheles marshallii TaxID=1521116 RepID=UPI00237B4E86
HVFLRNDTVRPALTTPYQGPYRILKRGPKSFQILHNGHPSFVSIDRLKPAYTTGEDTTPAEQPRPFEEPMMTSQRVTPTVDPLSPEQPSATCEPSSSATPTSQTQPQPILRRTTENNISTGVTRSQRRVVIPLRYR